MLRERENLLSYSFPDFTLGIYLVGEMVLLSKIAMLKAW